ncbi:hypothetical protein J6590_005240 [Homalodisca vitripennis]|nr:hypothetical protein J6590_005240 [Homalodisca vitripennis]
MEITLENTNFGSNQRDSDRNVTTVTVVGGVRAFSKTDNRKCEIHEADTLTAVSGAVHGLFCKSISRGTSLSCLLVTLHVHQLANTCAVQLAPMTCNDRSLDLCETQTKNPPSHILLVDKEEYVGHFFLHRHEGIEPRRPIFSEGIKRCGFFSRRTDLECLEILFGTNPLPQAHVANASDLLCKFIAPFRLGEPSALGQQTEESRFPCSTHTLLEPPACLDSMYRLDLESEVSLPASHSRNYLKTESQSCLLSNGKTG